MRGIYSRTGKMETLFSVRVTCRSPDCQAPRLEHAYVREHQLILPVLRAHTQHGAHGLDVEIRRVSERVGEWKHSG